MGSSDTRGRIRTELLRLMEEKPIERITVKEIVANLGLSRGTFYLYYDSSYAVLQEIEDEFFAEHERVFSRYLNCPLDDIYFNYPHPALLELMHVVREEGDVYRALMGPNGEELFQHKVDKLFLKFVIRLAEQEGYIHIEERFRDFYDSYFLMAHREVLYYLAQNGGSGTDEEYAVRFYRLIFAPFRTSYS